MKKETKKPRYTGKCFICNKTIESETPIKHEHDMVVNDNKKMTSKYIKGSK